MIIRKCDYCGKEINVFIKVQTTIGATEGYEYVNVSGLLYLKRNIDLCKDCANEMIQKYLGKKEKVNDHSAS